MSPKTNITFDHPIKQRIDGIEKSYGVEIKYTPEDKEIRYVITIAYISSIHDDYHCKIDRKQVFINGAQPKRLVDVMAERCMNCIYPIDLQISPFDGINNVLNFNEVKERWNTSLKDLKKEYEGDFSNQYFDQINQSLLDQDTFFEALKNEMIYTLLFFKKEALYEKEHLKHDVMYQLPIRPYQSISEFIGNQRIRFRDQQMIFEYTGKNDEKDSLELKHSIDQEDFTVQTITGKYLTSNQEKEILFTVTELKEREKKYVEKSDVPEEIPKEMIKKKKWFPNLFNQNKK